VSTHIFCSVSLQQAVDLVSMGREEGWRMGRGPDRCSELHSHRRECEGWLLCHQWRGEQSGSRDRGCSLGWLAASWLHAAVALACQHTLLLRKACELKHSTLLMQLSPSYTLGV